MSDNVRPGSPAAFKQRHEAYQIKQTFQEDISNARSLLHQDGMASVAKRILQSTVDAVDRNPQAQAMLKTAAVGDPAPRTVPIIAEARQLLKEATYQASREVRTVSASEWQVAMDGTSETRRLIGKSDAGWHGAVEVSYRGGESGYVAWSGPVSSQAKAERIAVAGEYREHSPPEPKPQIERLTLARSAPRLAR